MIALSVIALVMIGISIFLNMAVFGTTDDDAVEGVTFVSMATMAFSVVVISIFLGLR
jgi:hypothetical protein